MAYSTIPRIKYTEDKNTVTPVVYVCASACDACAFNLGGRMNFTHNSPESLFTMTARVLVQVICVLAVACSVEAMPNIRAEYPDPENYNVVTLSCSDSFGNLLDDITFLKRVPGQMISMPLSDNDVTLTQEREGYFSCSSVSEGTSSEIGLAGVL